jgi:hypothetical protein
MLLSFGKVAISVELLELLALVALLALLALSTSKA